MLDIKYIRAHADEVKESAARRKLNFDVDKLLALDSERTQYLQVSQNLRSQLKPDAKPDASSLAKLKKIKAEYEVAETSLKRVSIEFENLLALTPNQIAPETPDGGEEQNREEEKWGETKFDFVAKDHVELGAIHQLFNFEAGAKVAGNKFYYLTGKAVKLWQATLRLASEIVEEHGFTLMMVPQLVNERTAAGTGYLPRGEEGQNYCDSTHKLVLIATAEIPLTGYHADEVLDLAKPKKYAGISTCYRVEAGAYGKYSKGLYRVHQFEKLELYSFSSSPGSDAELENIVKIQRQIAEALNIPYRVVRSAVGDLSAAAYKKYDIEYFSPTDKTYRELTSASNATDYQARRLNIKYRENDKLELAHTINGTAVTSSRTLIAILENNQTESGEVNIPERLVAYYGAEKL